MRTSWRTPDSRGLEPHGAAWTDGEIGDESVHSSGRARARTGQAVIVGDDPLHLEFFGGHDAAGHAVWTRDFARIKPLIAWNNRMGSVTITYDAPLEKYLMCVTDGWPGVKEMNTYTLASSSIKGPWKMVTFMRAFGRQGYFVNFPSKFIAADGRTAWLCYSANFHERYFANRAEAAPLGSRYALTLQEVHLLDPAEAERLSHQGRHADPIKSGEAFLVDSVSATTQEVGLAEIAVFRAAR